MKILFWSALIIAAIWWLMKRNLGGGNDLTAHFAEQKHLQSVGDSALSANKISTGNWPLSTIGDTPLAGIQIDPFNVNNPFAQAKSAIVMPGTPNQLFQN